MNRRGALSRSGVCILMALAGCSEADPEEALPQSVVYIGTDAAIPQFGDRLLIEGLNEDGEICSDCRRLFAISKPSDLPVSFGVVPKGTTQRARVRARLFRSRQTGPDGLPVGEALLDAVGRVPELNGKTSVALELRMDCFGVPSDVAAGMTCDPKSRELVPEPVLPYWSDEGSLPLAGSWPKLQPKPCDGDAPEGMVCVPGGVFLLGDPEAQVWNANEILDFRSERVVELSPFAMDVDEVTVGTVRKLLVENKIPYAPDERAGTPIDEEYACTFLGAGDASNDAMPVNCLPRALAAAVCEAMDKRLPTEAEWEYAAGNLAEETDYPWGGDPDLCSLAIVGRGRSFTMGEVVSSAVEFEVCRMVNSPKPLPWGPVAGGSAADVTALGVRNLIGNMSEFVVDQLARYTDPCWHSDAWPLVDPWCAEASAGFDKYVALRGGSWAGIAFGERAVNRNSIFGLGPSPLNGIRCVKSM